MSDLTSRLLTFQFFQLARKGHPGSNQCKHWYPENAHHVVNAKCVFRTQRWPKHHGLHTPRVSSIVIAFHARCPQCFRTKNVAVALAPRTSEIAHAYSCHSNMSKSDRPRTLGTATCRKSTPTRLLPFSLCSSFRVFLSCPVSFPLALRYPATASDLASAGIA